MWSQPLLRLHSDVVGAKVDMPRVRCRHVSPAFPPVPGGSWDSECTRRVGWEYCAVQFRWISFPECASCDSQCVDWSGELWCCRKKIKAVGKIHKAVMTRDRPVISDLCARLYIIASEANISTLTRDLAEHQENTRCLWGSMGDVRDSIGRKTAPGLSETPIGTHRRSLD